MLLVYCIFLVNKSLMNLIKPYLISLRVASLSPAAAVRLSMLSSADYHPQAYCRQAVSGANGEQNSPAYMLEV